MLRKLIFFLFPLFLVQCEKTLPLPFGAEMRKIPVDSASNGKIDSMGYYIPESENYRILYIEIDKDGNGSSDEFIWQGVATLQDPKSPVKNMQKVHEQVDENNDGKIDLIRWLLPNEIIAMVQKDSDRDGYFESVFYYNLKKKVVRRELDPNKKGKPSIFIFFDRAEIDSDEDGYPDLVVYGKSELELEEKAVNKRETKPLKKEDSLLLNPSKLPQTERPLLGSGMI
ncbi:MAG: hypothetical protein O9301_07195 [Leptospira sp.]|nr:hypothetical protein [Leptospira sp.]